MTPISTIPVRNVYYLLCYAWNCLEEGEPQGVQHESAKSLIELLGRVLVSGTTQLLKRGLHRTYVGRGEVVVGVRGQLQMTETVSRQLHLRATTFCRYDELSHDDLANRILKASLRTVLRYEEIDQELRSDVDLLVHRFADVADIPLRGDAFRQVQVHRNNQLYGFLLQVCRFIYDNAFVEEDGHATFRDFLRDHDKMAKLFERFVYNFLSREQSDYIVSRNRLQWHESAGIVSPAEFLPKMYTDVVLTSQPAKAGVPRIIVLDTKYYAEAFQHHHETPKGKSENLYQLFAYLKNAEAERQGVPAQINGVLLYPANGQEFVEEATLLGHHVSVRSVNLAKQWCEIHAELLKVCPQS